MKYVYFVLLLSTSLIAQNVDSNHQFSKYRAVMDLGYFGSSFQPASSGGNYLNAGFGYKINEEFWLNFNFIKISSKGTFDQSILFKNNITDYSNTLLIPNFSKDWNVFNKIYIGGSLGCAFMFEQTLYPSVIFDESLQLPTIVFENRGETFNIALFMDFSVKYQLQKQILFLVSAKTYAPMYLDIDSFLIGCGLEIKL